LNLAGVTDENYGSLTHHNGVLAEEASRKKSIIFYLLGGIKQAGAACQIHALFKTFLSA
jgi:hypothetical protein